MYLAEVEEAQADAACREQNRTIIERVSVDSFRLVFGE